jgi:hypothetical protein
LSEIIRKLSGLAPNPALHGLTTKELAVLCHEAEATENDVLQIDVSVELDRREARFPGARRLFMDWYRILAAQKKPPQQGA